MIGRHAVAASASRALIGGRGLPLTVHPRPCSVWLDLSSLAFLSAVGRSRCPLASHVPPLNSCFEFDAPLIGSLQPLETPQLRRVCDTGACLCVRVFFCGRARYFGVLET